MLRHMIPDCILCLDDIFRSVMPVDEELPLCHVALMLTMVRCGEYTEEIAQKPSDYDKVNLTRDLAAYLVNNSITVGYMHDYLWLIG